MLAELLYSKMYPVYIIPSTNLYAQFDIQRDIATFWSAAVDAQKAGTENSPLYTFAIISYFSPRVEDTQPELKRAESRQNLDPPPKSRTVDSLPSLPESRTIDSLPELPKRKGIFDDVTPKEQLLGNLDYYVHPKVKKQSSASGGSVGKLKVGTSTIGSSSRVSSSSFAITSNQNTPEIEVRLHFHLISETNATAFSKTPILKFRSIDYPRSFRRPHPRNGRRKLPRYR
jgi:hypothetical protein